MRIDPASSSYKRRVGVHRNTISVFAGVILLLQAPLASAQDFLERTFLVEVTAGSGRSAIARGLSFGGYELDEGDPVNFADWYTPRFPDVNFIFLTELSPTTGMTWGISLGERGEKYSIDPGLWLGLIHRMDLGHKSHLTISAITMLGGDFREKSCFGFYKTINAEAEVNCRLAASILPPADTLKFLVSEPGYREARVTLRYEIQF